MFSCRSTCVINLSRHALLLLVPSSDITYRNSPNALLAAACLILFSYQCTTVINSSRPDLLLLVPSFERPFRSGRIVSKMNFRSKIWVHRDAYSILSIWHSCTDCNHPLKKQALITTLLRLLVCVKLRLKAQPKNIFTL